jgi:hypothetical protein
LNPPIVKDLYPAWFGSVALTVSVIDMIYSF